MSASIHSGAPEYSNRTTWSMGDSRNDNSQFGRFRDKCGAFVNANSIQKFMTIVLVANSLLLGLVTFDFVTQNSTLQWQLEQVDLAMLAAFTIEFLLQAIYLGPHFLRDGWLVFDFLIIVMSWAFSNSPITVLRSFRIFRIFALVQKNRSMKTLLGALIGSIPSLVAVAAVLCLFMYVFAVLFTGLYGDLYDEGYLDWDYFGRLDLSFITLYQLMTTTSWVGVVRQVMVARPRAWIGLYAYVIITGIIVVNLFVAVVCESLVDVKLTELHEGDDDTEQSAANAPPSHEASADTIANLRREIQDSLQAHEKMQQKLEIILSRLPS